MPIQKMHISLSSLLDKILFHVRLKVVLIGRFRAMGFCTGNKVLGQKKTGEIDSYL